MPLFYFAIFVEEIEKDFRPIVLSKLICRNCLESKGIIWGDMEENLWNRDKKVFCIACENIVNTDKKIDNCQYKLEYVVMTQRRG